MNKFMYKALEEAVYGTEKGFGGPFGAVITLNNNIISSAHNEVLKTKDPTSHAEINAIRKASKILNTFNLKNCVLYTTCEPCPMCLSAIYWANITKIYYGCTRYDADKIGFSDNDIYDFFSGKSKTKNLKLFQIEHNNCIKVFNNWLKNPDRKLY